MADVTPIAENNHPQTPFLSNEVYDRLKWLVQIVLPAIGALYAGLAALWGFPHGTEVVGTLALLATFGGAVLGFSTRSYNNSDAKFDGDLNVYQLPEGPHAVQVALNDHPGGLDEGQAVTLKVQKQSDQAPDLPVE